MEDEASAEPKPAGPPATAGADATPQARPDRPDLPDVERRSPDRLQLAPELERRLRKLSGQNAPLRGPIVASTRGWVSREARWPVFAARFLDFAVLTDEHLVLCSTGFFSRRPRRQVLREPLRRLFVTPIGRAPIRTLRIAGDFSRKIRMELHADEHTDRFVKELLERSPANPRLRAEPWAAIGQLGVDPPPPALPAAREPATDEPEVDTP